MWANHSRRSIYGGRHGQEDVRSLVRWIKNLINAQPAWLGTIAGGEVISADFLFAFLMDGAVSAAGDERLARVDKGNEFHAVPMGVEQTISLAD